MRVWDSDDDMLGNEEYDLLYPLQLRSISKRKEGRKVEMQEGNKEVFVLVAMGGEVLFSGWLAD